MFSLERTDVISVEHIELPVVVFGIINAMLAYTAIVTGYPLLLIRDGRSLPLFTLKPTTEITKERKNPPIM